MKVKNLIKFNRQFRIVNQLSASEFRNIFAEKYINTNKTKFKGKVEKDILLLWRDKIVIKVPAFEILEIKLDNSDNMCILNGEVKLTRTAKFSFLFSLVFVLIVFFSYIFKIGFELEIILPSFGLIFCGLMVIHSELNTAKNDYLAELKQVLI